MQRLALIAWASITCLMSQARATPLDTSQGIAKDLSFIETQVTKTLKTLTSLGSPSPTPLYPVSGGDSGTWKTTSPSSGSQGWTSGFFPGQLWLLYQATGSPQWLAAARQWTAPLASQASSVTRIDPTDIGFIIGTSFGNGYRLTGDPSYKNVLLTAGGSLASLYNSKVGAVRSWTFGPWQFPVIVDSMMTLGPLQWGASNGGSSAWAGIAATHAQTVTTNLVRSDGSTYQLANFNPTTGARLSQGTFAGYSNTSTWARGEAWALYGFAQAYLTSHNPAFLTTAEAVANYFVGHLPANDIAPWDFGAPATPTRPVDTSAAAIAADGLVMLSTVAGTKTHYLQDAESILGSLSSSYLGPRSGESVLFDGYPGVNGTNTALIYGDYYFTEALLRLQNVLDGQPGWVLYTPQSVLGGQPARLLSSLTVPEPSTWAMMLLGFAGLGFAGYRRTGAGRATLGRLEQFVPGRNPPPSAPRQLTSVARS
jgi:unsaturated chondroitin disaccharide hydrolase